MSVIQNKLFWEKYRPQTLDEVILPNRIKNLVEGGVQTNMIFVGKSGLGKTTLARILLKDHPHEQFNSKLGVETLRTKVKKFCTQSLPFEDPNKLRVVYFEEFDTASSAMQEELKSFIEEYEHRVRFIATCNHISKITPEIKSRFNIVDFTPLTQDETKAKRVAYYKKIEEKLNEDNIKFDPKVIKDIIIKQFPDFRSIWTSVHEYVLTGVNTSTLTLGEDKIFEMIMDNNSNSIQMWDYLFTNWLDKIDVAYSKLGKDFINWIKINKSDKVNKIPDLVITLSEYTDIRKPNSLDPFVTLCALVYKFKEILD